MASRAGEANRRDEEANGRRDARATDDDARATEGAGRRGASERWYFYRSIAPGRGPRADDGRARARGRGIREDD